MPVIIVEGVDLSGKTTAIEIISKFFNSGFVLKNAFKPRTKEESQDIYAQYWTIAGLIHNTKYTKKNLIILDRFYPSQAVYSILRGEDEMKDYKLLDIQKFCKSQEYGYIYLDTPNRDLEARYNEKGDEHIKKYKDILMLKKRYQEFYDTCTLKKIKINTLDKDWLKQVKKFLKEGWNFEKKGDEAKTRR